LAETLGRELPGAETVRWKAFDAGEAFGRFDGLVFIGSLGICVRTIAPHIVDKESDPAVVCIDSAGAHAIPVLSGHRGGANELAARCARILGGQVVLTTQSDVAGLWPLDLLGGRNGWKTEAGTGGMNPAIAAFVNRRPTALLLDIRDGGTESLERTLPEHVDMYHDFLAVPWEKYELFLAVTPRVYRLPKALPALWFRPPVLHLGVGCRKDARTEGAAEYIRESLIESGLSPESVCDLSTIELKRGEPMLDALSRAFGNIPVRIYAQQELEGIAVEHPSEKVRAATGLPGVAEPAAIRSAEGGPLMLAKQRAALHAGSDFTFAAALDRAAVRGGRIEIVGAGPGDPELISVRGCRLLEVADLILYAGSLVPERLTHYAKPGAVVRNSASMTLEEQFELIREYYDAGKLVVRLHTGDPCIYGAIQEQMAFFDDRGMSYRITPGISSFQAAAAVLHSQFTIPEATQTIILTRGGGGKTPMPEREKLSELARSRSTMCIFLSADLVEGVQAELLEHYPPQTPVAACYKLTWPEERIYRGQLRDLAAIVRENGLTLTTMIVVGEAIGNRSGLSRLYSSEFKHLFRS
jgi:precorrin-4 C11-methyltransferase